MAIKVVSSKSNPLFKQIKSIANDNTAYRQSQQIWLEGEHLCQAAIDSGLSLSYLVLMDSVSPDISSRWAAYCENTIQVPLVLMAALSALPSPSWIGAVITLPLSNSLDLSESAVVLDKVQDPGNAGAILRCAAAFGFQQVWTTKETVAMWSTKVIRSAMGAHFGLKITESMHIETILHTRMPVLLTDVHHGEYLHRLNASDQLPWPCIWVFGHEGKGVSDQWKAAHIRKVRIAQPGGQESLNVASAAAICLHASASQRVEKC